MIDIEYPCGCKYYHSGLSKVDTCHLCADHKIIIIKDRLKEMA